MLFSQKYIVKTCQITTNMRLGKLAKRDLANYPFIGFLGGVFMITFRLLFTGFSEKIIYLSQNPQQIPDLSNLPLGLTVAATCFTFYKTQYYLTSRIGKPEKFFEDLYPIKKVMWGEDYAMTSTYEKMTFYNVESANKFAKKMLDDHIGDSAFYGQSLDSFEAKLLFFNLRRKHNQDAIDATLHIAHLRAPYAELTQFFVRRTDNPRIRTYLHRILDDTDLTQTERLTFFSANGALKDLREIPIKPITDLMKKNHADSLDWLDEHWAPFLQSVFRDATTAYAQGELADLGYAFTTKTIKKLMKEPDELLVDLAVVTSQTPIPQEKLTSIAKGISTKSEFMTDYYLPSTTISSLVKIQAIRHTLIKNMALDGVPGVIQIF